MKIIVLVKEVPDTYGDRTLDLETGLTDRAASSPVLDEISERSLEVALSYADANEGVEVIALSVAPESATPTVRKALAVGAARAIQVIDEDLHGADIILTAEALAAAAQKEGFDLIIAGNAATDGMSGMVPAAIAEHLEVALLTGLSEVQLTDTTVAGKRPVEGGVQQVSASLPAVISITEALPDGRFPSLKGIMAAKKKSLETHTLADLDITVDLATVSRSIMLGVTERPPREAGVKIADDGSAGERLADFLVENRLA